MDPVDPKIRAEIDQKQAARERDEAMDRFGTAADLSKTAEHLRAAGYTEAAAPLDAAADRIASAGSVDLAQAQLLGSAAAMWRSTERDLLQEEKLRDRAAFTDIAGHYSEYEAAKAPTEAERSHDLEEARRFHDEARRIWAEGQAQGAVANAEDAIARSLEEEAARLDK